MASASDYVLLCTHELVDGLAGLSASIKESFEKMTPDDIDAGFESFMLFVRKVHARLAEQLEASASAEAQRHRDAMRAAERRFESKVVGLRRAMETRMRDITAVLEHQRVELEEKRDAAATALAQAKQDKEALDMATTRLTALEVASSERKNQKAASLAFGITMLTPPGSFAMKDGTAITATEDFLIAPPAQAVSEEEPQAPASNFIDFDEEQQKELIALRHEVNTLRVNIVTERTNAQAAKEQVEVELKQAVAETSKLSAQVRALSEDLRKSREAEARLAQFLEDEKESHAGSRLRAEKLQESGSARSL